jgi:hypothetical protein
MLAAVLDRHHLGALLDEEPRNALWTVDLVARERQEIDTEGIEIDRQLAEGLDGIDVEIRIVSGLRLRLTASGSTRPNPSTGR